MRPVCWATATLTGCSRRRKRVTSGSISRGLGHGWIARGDLMWVLQEHGGLKPFRLAEIKRQESGLYKAAVQLLSKGKTLEGFDKLDAIGWVKEIREGDRYHALAADYVQALKECKKWNDVLVVLPDSRGGRADHRSHPGDAPARRKAGQGSAARIYPTDRCQPDGSRARRRAKLPARRRRCPPVPSEWQGIQEGDRIRVEEANSLILPLNQSSSFQAYRSAVSKLAAGDVIRFTSGGTTLDG